MSKTKLFNIWRRRIKVKLPSFLRANKTLLSIRAGEQIKKIGNLGQELVVMRMG